MKNKNQDEIIVRLRGGLGNQLHGLYAGLFLAQTLNRGLVLDGRFIKFGGNLERNLEIDKLNLGIQNTRVTFMKAFPLPKNKIGRFATRPLHNTIFEKLARNSPSICITDADDLYNVKADQAVLLDGYFPSMRYFEHLDKYSEFPHPIPIYQSHKFKQLKNKMKNLNSLHIRLGDYLLHENIYPIASEEYYFRALEILGDDSRYIIFVENKEEVVRYYPKLSSSAFAIYDNRDFDAVETFSLLSHSMNLVCANSTFSSWAGQFVSRRNKGVVICPEEFLKDSFEDFRPANWIRLNF